MKNIKNIFNPNWITGFVDAKGCFYIRLAIDKNYNKDDLFKLVFKYNFIIKIKTYFNEVGIIYITKDKKSCVYQVHAFNSITNIIIPHFNKYPLENINLLC